MKTLKKTTLLLAIPILLMGLQGCMIIQPVPMRVESHHRHVPPGQHKKMHGYQNAKHFAPGQQYKKHK